MQKQYRDKAVKAAEDKKAEENFFFPPQDGYPEFNCMASCLTKAEEKYREFKEIRK